MRTILSYSQSWLEKHNALFTAEEIVHQPRLWRELYRELESNAAQWQPFLSSLLVKPDLQIILCGAGSSAFIGKAMAPWLREHCGLNVYAYASTDIVPTPWQYLEKQRPTLLVSYARSGNSPESVGAIELVNQLADDVYHLILTCNPDGSLTHYVKVKRAEGKNNACSLIMPKGSHDRSFAMTSSFSCMMLATLLLLGKPDFARAGQLVEEMATLCEKCFSEWLPLVQKVSQSGFSRMVALGSGCFTGIAEEGALKMLELTAGEVATRFDSTLGVRHGPKFMIDENTLVVVMLSAEAYCRRYDIDLLNELKHDELAKQIIPLSSLPLPGAVELNSGLSDIWLMFPYLIFFQLLAFNTSLSHSLSPDNPCPTGEVNRVVKGVQLYPCQHTK
ncbi:SIS domain-containing protein [Xenorhabdus thuongxuanensis]|uniref:Tagatose-6-phosphate ketose isomerase n=1 Tax=Xenorhabdus thuongxuanensis TaxID=1873484 RepID=A0A1Q5U858_9GAMM|nr:SIS domain-containing protein [Xenorhabdus thuongxuanensis]OKP08654.1 tagatose-6-phosphate ketose isomerase [Xenorhabdus thuongxuanensis]